MPIKEILDIISTVTNSEKALEARAFIFDLERELYALKNENIELKTQLYDYKKHIDEDLKWEDAKALYKPYQTQCDALVYVPIKQGELKEFFCPVCFSSRKIIHLQPLLNKNFKECPVCKISFQFSDFSENRITVES